MAFGQPYVLDESGQILGNALGSTGQTIANAILQRKALARQGAMFSIQNPGFHFLAPGQQPPADDQTLNVQGSPQVGVTPTAFQKGINDALSQGTTPQAPPQPGSVTRASQPIVRGNGYYFDPNEYMRIVGPRMQLTGLGEYYKNMFGGMGKLAGDPYQVGVEQSTIARNLGQAHASERAANAPHLGDTNYAPAMGDVAAAQANARVPATNQETAYRVGQETAAQKTLIPIRAAAEAQAYGARLNLQLANTPLNPTESQATTQLPMIANGLKVLRSIPMPDARTMATSGGHWFANFLNTPQGRQWSQAAQQVALSGAVAQEGTRGSQLDRVAYYKQTYVPIAGDDEKTAEQKMASLNNLLRGIKVTSGRGYSRLPADIQQTIDGVIGTGMGAGSTQGSGVLGGNPYLSGTTGGSQ